MEESGFESVLCVKPDVPVHRIPPRATNRGYRATEGALCSRPSGSVSWHGYGEHGGFQQDHFKWVKEQCEFAKQAQNPDQSPNLDLEFKEGQAIKLNIANMKKEGAARISEPRLPWGDPSSSQPAVAPTSGGASVPWPQPKPPTAAIWGDFTKSTGSTSSQTQPGWVQF
uniref:NECAP PHear domain-containing protein n=1 Tax=Cebus imitator TaxID=2715852 RepID=A0A2K5R1N6_CEBIM